MAEAPLKLVAFPAPDQSGKKRKGAIDLLNEAIRFHEGEIKALREWGGKLIDANGTDADRYHRVRKTTNVVLKGQSVRTP